MTGVDDEGDGDAGDGGSDARAGDAPVEGAGSDADADPAVEPPPDADTDAHPTADADTDAHPASDADTDAHPDTDPAADWRAALAETGRLTPAIVDAVVSTHGGRGRRAIEAVSEGRVKQYRDFTVVVGYEDEYVVEGGQCTCKDAEYNLSQTDPDQRCWHSVAVDVARRVGEVDHHDMWYSEVREFL